MNLVRYRPHGMTGRALRDMDNCWSEFDSGKKQWGEDNCNYSPRIDIREDEKEFRFIVEVPGIPKEEIKVLVDQENVLSIKGEKQREEIDEKASYHRTERCFGEFERSFYLPDNVNAESIEAKYEYGVLNITVQKVEPEKPKEIEVKVD